MYRLKEKLKLLKLDLKEWNNHCFGRITNKIDEALTQVNRLDLKREQ